MLFAPRAPAEGELADTAKRAVKLKLQTQSSKILMKTCQTEMGSGLVWRLYKRCWLFRRLSLRIFPTLSLILTDLKENPSFCLVRKPGPTPKPFPEAQKSSPFPRIPHPAGFTGLSVKNSLP